MPMNVIQSNSRRPNMTKDKPTGTEAVLTVEEVADQVRLSKKFIYREIKAGELESLRFGRSIKITQSAFAQWRDRHRT
jgi:excisionase family DNA binding protein